jgi:hypothetical protein
MSKLQLFRKVIKSFTEASSFTPEPPLRFYLKGRPFLEEPYQIATPNQYVYLLNGVTFRTYENSGYHVCIEDGPGLIAVVCAATSWAGQLANLDEITGWRRYRDDDRTLIRSIESFR